MLVEARQTSEQHTLFMPTVAAWHAACWFETSFHLSQSFPRSQKLWHRMGEAYRAKREAIESGNFTPVKQAAAYFTEVTGAVGVRHDKLPQALKTGCQRFLDIGFNDSLAQDPDLATADKDEAKKKSSFFCRKLESWALITAAARLSFSSWLLPTAWPLTLSSSAGRVGV